jgi:hypothetical protein
VCSRAFLNDAQTILIDCESIAQQTSKAIHCGVEISIPLKKNKVFRFYLPKSILDLIRMKRKWRRKYKETKKDEHKKEYNKYAHLVRVEIIKHRNNNWEAFLEKIGTSHPCSTKTFWLCINKFRMKKKSSIPTLTVNGKNYSTDSEKGMLFSKILADTFSEDPNIKNDKKFGN